MTEASVEPSWRQRAIERSTSTAQFHAGQRVQSLLDAAQELIAEKGTTNFTVQEVVDRSRQTLRRFYQHFDGKHELLLGLFEEALSRTATDVREAITTTTDPLQRLRVAIETLYERSQISSTTRGPLFTDFGLQLMYTHPEEVSAAHLPLLTLFTELIEHAVDSGTLMIEKPRRQASLLLQTVIFVSRDNGVPADSNVTRITADEVWQFCLGGLSGNVQ